MKTDKLDFAAGDYKPTFPQTKAELLQKLEDDYEKTKETLDNTREEELSGDCHCIWEKRFLPNILNTVRCDIR